MKVTISCRHPLSRQCTEVLEQGGKVPPTHQDDDSRLTFYTVYKREATEHETDYVRKYDDNLNTTLIFVRFSSRAVVNYLTRAYRQVCSPPSVQLLLSTSNQTSNPTQTTNLWPSSAPSSSLSISLLSPARPPSFHLFKKIHRTRSSL